MKVSVLLCADRFNYGASRVFLAPEGLGHRTYARSDVINPPFAVDKWLRADATRRGRTKSVLTASGRDGARKKYARREREIVDARCILICLRA